jgi:hypothetical protein
MGEPNDRGAVNDIARIRGLHAQLTVLLVRYAANDVLTPFGKYF